jgi:hypothetical protein
LHIVENVNRQAGKIYCSACESVWNKKTHRYDKPRIAIGKLEGDPPSFVPNKYFAQPLAKNPSHTATEEKLIISTAVKKYGEAILELGKIDAVKSLDPSYIQTAKAMFTGPAMVFGGITKRYST